MTKDSKQKLFLLSIIAILLVYVFTLRSCGNGKTEIVEVSIPAIIKSFDKKVPTPIKYDAIQPKEIIVAGDTVQVENPVNIELAEKYMKAKDSIERLKLHMSAIEINRYKETFEDENVKIDIEAETTGKLNWMKPTYVRKEIKAEVPVKVKEPVFSMYIGGGISDNVKLDAFAAEVEVGFQNKKGDIISAGYDTQKNISLKYTKRIFQIKK